MVNNFPQQPTILDSSSTFKVKILIKGPVINKLECHNFHSQTGQAIFQLLTEYIWHHSFQVEIDKNAW